MYTHRKVSFFRQSDLSIHVHVVLHTFEQHTENPGCTCPAIAVARKQQIRLNQILKCLLPQRGILLPTISTQHLSRFQHGIIPHNLVAQHGIRSTRN